MNKDSYKTTTDLRAKVNMELYKELGVLLSQSRDLRFGQAVMFFFKNDTNERMTEFESSIIFEEPSVTLARFNNLKENNE